jgi:tRNA-Thr(GGU) m(6)t(6)A37 methyltransferase TsaA
MDVDVDRKSFVVNPIGYVESKYNHFDDVPHSHGNKRWVEDTSTIVLYPEHARKIQGLDGYSHLIILYWIHKSDEWKMPKHHHRPPRVKVFATRMPVRPNPIGLSVVEMLSFSSDKGMVSVKGLDALNGTPILDIKPYIPDFDSFPEACLPEWVGRHLKEHHHEHKKENEI